MTDLDSATAATGSRTDRPRLHAALAALCVTQITGWGGLYYAFPVLAPRIAADTGWLLPATTAAFSAALITAALVGIPVGRILDRHGPRAVMTDGSSLGAASVLGIATAPNLPLFTAAWLCAGKAVDDVRPIRDETEGRVRGLLDDLGRPGPPLTHRPWQSRASRCQCHRRRCQ